MQLVITSELSEDKNLWLRNFTNDLKSISSIEKLSIEYRKHEHDELYKSIINIIIQANKEQFKEVKDVCEALKKLFADELESSRNDGLKESRMEGIKPLILSCKELGGTRDTILGMVVKNFEITADKAEKYMKLYL